MHAIGADNDRGALGHHPTTIRTPSYANYPAVVPEEIVDGELLAQFHAGGYRGIHENLVENDASGRVTRVHPVALLHGHPQRKITEVGGEIVDRWAVRRYDGWQEAPTVQLRHA